MNASRTFLALTLFASSVSIGFSVQPTSALDAEATALVTNAVGAAKAAYAARTASMGEADEIDADESKPSSIRAEMRHGAAGGYVLQVWNTTDAPIKCVATLNNPTLKKAPTYRFRLNPHQEKPQELGAGQFGGRRILDDPPCTVTVTITATGETHTYQP